MMDPEDWRLLEQAAEEVRQTKWDTRFMQMAMLVAGWSKDRSTAVGAVIVGKHREILSTGYNGFPRGVDDDIDVRHTRPTKYLYTSHAEENAVAHAAGSSLSLAGGTLYCTMHPCASCARAIINARIERVVAPESDRADWEEQAQAARNMFREARVPLSLFTQVACDSHR